MSFKGLRFAGLEWKNITASKVMWVVIAAIAIMPLLYGALYLAAFQDPYARLNTVPVAVVNRDEGAVISAERRNLGDDVVRQLKDTDDGLQWHFVSADEAQEGLEDGTYFMTCTIPSDFSQSVASADSSEPEKAQLKVDYNQSENMLASQIGETVWKEVRQRVSDTVAAEYWTTVLGRVADSGKDIQTAADGAGTLEDGLVTAKDGSSAIASNLGTLKDGALALDSGLGNLVGGASALDAGLGTLSGGASTLKDGTSSLVTGANQLHDGANQVAGGANDVASGASKLQSDGTSKLAAGASELAEATGALPDEAKAEEFNQGVASLDAGFGASDDASQATVNGGLNNVSAGLDALDASVKAGTAQLSAGIGASSDSGTKTLYGALNTQSALLQAAAADPANAATYIAQAQAINEGLKSSAAQLGGGLAQIDSGVEDGTSKLKAGVASVKNGVAQVQTGAEALLASVSPLVNSAPTLRAAVLQLDAGASEVNANMSALVAGSSQVASGASQVSDGAASAVSGASQLNDGAAQLVDGAQSAKSGAGQLAAGAQSAQDGSVQLADGAAQLEEGAGTLTTGLADAVDGSGELASKLADGAKTAADQTENISGKSEMMSDPVELVNEYYTTVKNYGTGFAPYFMALGLWVGGLVAGFVFKPLNSRLILSGANPVTVAFANYLPVAFFSLIQATLLMVVLQFGLQLQIDNVPAFYAMGYLTALVFAAIMQVLMAAFGFPGKFVAIILLMLQLTACAGTFPIQTTPDFFQAINPFMPMTYVVQGMRQIMTGLDYAVVGFDCFVLFAIGAACFALTCLVAYRKRTVRMEDLHPVLQLG